LHCFTVAPPATLHARVRGRPKTRGSYARYVYAYSGSNNGESCSAGAAPPLTRPTCQPCGCPGRAEPPRDLAGASVERRRRRWATKPQRPGNGCCKGCEHNPGACRPPLLPRPSPPLHHSSWPRNAVTLTALKAESPLDARTRVHLEHPGACLADETGEGARPSPARARQA